MCSETFNLRGARHRQLTHSSALLFVAVTKRMLGILKPRSTLHGSVVIERSWNTQKQNKLRGLSPHANYTDRAAAAGRRS